MLTIVTAAVESNLSSLEKLKAALYGATATSTGNDELLSDYLARASNVIEEYLGYPLMRQVYSETLAGYGDNSLMVSRTPVMAIGELNDGDDLITSTGYVIEEPKAGLIRRDEGFPWTAGIGADLSMRPVVGSELRRFTCIYEAGYILNGSTSTEGWLTTSTGRTLPHWAEQATLETAKSFFKRRSVDGAIKSKSIGNLSITYGGSGSGGVEELPAPALALLQGKVRRV